MLVSIGEWLTKWWYGGNLRSRAKDDYLKLSKLNLEVIDPFPGEEDALFAQYENQYL